MCDVHERLLLQSSENCVKSLFDEEKDLIVVSLPLYDHLFSAVVDFWQFSRLQRVVVLGFCSVRKTEIIMKY